MGSFVRVCTGTVLLVKHEINSCFASLKLKIETPETWNSLVFTLTYVALFSDLKEESACA